MVNADISSDGKSLLDGKSLAPSQPETAADEGSNRPGIGDFARTLAYSAIQSPVTAVSQILDKATGTNVAPNINMMEKADEGSFGSARWHVQQVAAGVGALVPFLAALAVTKNISRAVQAEELALKYCAGSVASTASNFRTGEMAVAGLIQGAVLEPNQNKDKFFQERLTQGITSGATMGAMHAFSNKFADWTGASASGASLLNKSLTTGLAGGAGGLVGLETHGVLTGESLTGTQAIQSVYQAAFTGAALGALGSAQLRLHQPKSGLTNLENHLARNAESQIFDVGFFDQHKERTAGWSMPKAGSDPRPLTPLERVEMVSILHRDADTLLRQSQTMKSFIEKIRGIRSDDFDIADKKDDDIWTRIASLRRAMDLRPVDGESKQDGRDYSAIKRLHKKALKASDQTDEELETTKENYRARLETAVNEFLSDHNLPKVEVLAGGKDFKPSADYLNGFVRVKRVMLGPPELEGELIDTLYHELTHLRQDALRINVIADKLGLPPEPTEADIQLVKNEFRRTLQQDRLAESPDLKDAAIVDDSVDKAIVEDSVDKAMVEDSVDKAIVDDSVDRGSIEERGDRLVEDVLRIRKDHPLPVSERQGAAKTSDNVYRYQADNAVGSIATAEVQIGALNRFIDGESNKFITNDFFADMREDPNKFERYFGFKDISPELLALEKEHRSNPLSKLVDLDTSEDIDTWDRQQTYFAELKQRLDPLLVQQLEVIEQRRDDLLKVKWKRYYSNPLERQAFSTGALSELTLRASEAS